MTTPGLSAARESLAWRAKNQAATAIQAAPATHTGDLTSQMRRYTNAVTTFRLGEAADLLGVSSDTVRRWIDGGRLAALRDENGHRTVDGAVLAEFARSLGDTEEQDRSGPVSSARNRFRGIVTRVVRDTVMAQVEIQAGPHRVVSLMSREAADELGLEPGMLTVAVVKSTNVVVELADGALPRANGRTEQVSS